MEIVPMRDLKDTVKIENLCEKSDGPVFITKNGYGKLVVMSIEYFEKLMNDAYEAQIILKGLEDVNNNKVYDGPTVFEELRTKYGFK